MKITRDRDSRLRFGVGFFQLHYYLQVRTINLFGEVWGIGPATALKLYEKGYRTLDDLKNEELLTNSQRIGLKYFQDIKHRIPRHEV
jgi:DNA polymerase lambda